MNHHTRMAAPPTGGGGMGCAWHGMGGVGMAWAGLLISWPAAPTVSLGQCLYLILCGFPALLGPYLGQ